MTSDPSEPHSSAERNRSPLDPTEFDALWLEFSRLFPNEESCLVAIYRLRSEVQDIQCRFCCTGLNFVPGQRMCICVRCSKRNWITAGTFFERARKLRPWIAAVWLLENGVVLSSLCFARLTKIAQSSALNILRKIGIVLESRSRENGWLTFPSIRFDEVIFRRSLETPRRSHPRKESSPCLDSSLGCDDSLNLDAELQRPENLENHGPCPSAGQAAETLTFVDLRKSGSPEQVDLSGMFAVVSQGRNSFAQFSESITDLELAILSKISQDPVSVDELCRAIPTASAQLFSALTILELNDLIKRCPGDCYVRVKADVSFSASVDSVDQSSLCSAIHFIRRVFQGVSRKYLQLYLSIIDALGYGGSPTGQWILRLLLQVDALRYSQVLEYVSPPELRLACCVDSLF